MSQIRLLVLFLILATTFYAQSEEDPLEVQLGEKLFKEDRFAQSYHADARGHSNQVLSKGDPILEFFETANGNLKHPMRGQRVSCASCHLVDQATSINNAMVFTYNDASILSRVPLRSDSQKRTVRNSMNMVMSSIEKGMPLHWDGEFFSPEDLSCASLKGRNMGWVQSESKIAESHIEKVLTGDNGSYPSDSDLKGSYAELFREIGFDFTTMNSKQIFQAACFAIGEYLKSIDFSRDSQGEFNGSAYDLFLEKNGIPRSKTAAQSSAEYIDLIRMVLSGPQSFKWISAKPMKYHKTAAKFGQLELDGMRLFFNRAQCVQCHTPPRFTDSLFHSVGISQLHYEAVHGKGSFAKLTIPKLKQRLSNPEKHFLSSAIHPSWKGDIYRSTPSKTLKNAVDLGVWNMIGHPDKKSIQGHLKDALCNSFPKSNCKSWSQQELLSKATATFKTPTLRSLGQSAPYFHNGLAATIDDVLVNYITVAGRARKGSLPFVDERLSQMNFTRKDFAALKAFLLALNEDYD